jgi:hypothetical protein
MTCATENAECLGNMYKFFVLLFLAHKVFGAFSSLTEYPELFYAINVTILLGLWCIVINGT